MFAVVGSTPILYLLYVQRYEAWVDFLAIAWAGLFGVLAIRTRCENCGVRILRYDKPGRGQIDPRGLVAWRKCPKCGLHRS